MVALSLGEVMPDCGSQWHLSSFRQVPFCIVKNKAERARYYASLLDAHIIPNSDDYKKLLTVPTI